MYYELGSERVKGSSFETQSRPGIQRQATKRKKTYNNNKTDLLLSSEINLRLKIPKPLFLPVTSTPRHLIAASFLVYPSYTVTFFKAPISSSGFPQTNISTSSGRSICYESKKTTKDNQTKLDKYTNTTITTPFSPRKHQPTVSFSRGVTRINIVQDSNR